MFYKDLYINIINVVRLINNKDFNINKNNCINVYLSKLFLFQDVAFYYLQCGYLLQQEYCEIMILLKNNIDKCCLKLEELYEV